jgi:phenylalanyl-tRNA synthetase alpha chain
MDMKEKLQQIAESARQSIEKAQSPEKLNDARLMFLGKKGELTQILKSMKDVSPEDRPKVGQLVNDARSHIEKMLEESRKKLEAAALEEKMKREVIDVTLPAKKAKLGHRHPNTIALEEVERIFVGMGYEVVEGPEVEYADYNFTKLNIPEDHPARDEQDTFFINDRILLRSQTSPVQARVMEQGKLPIRMIAPGRVFRSDEVDATHSPSFHQIEGLVIDKNITFADLKGTLQEFAKTVQGYSVVNVEHEHIHLKNGDAKYALYPVWILNTSWNGQKYTFAMNGQSGKFVGDLPSDKGKAWAIFFAVTVGVTAAAYVLGRLFGMI